MMENLTGEVIVPECTENGPVTTIEKKASLSKKKLRKITLPKSVESVGDWAFAHCDNLEEIRFENPETQLGRAVFLECPKLSKIWVRGKDEDTASLLATTVRLMDAAYLLNLREAGEEEWLRKWDARMLAILDADDMEGYSKQILCGEEDYGSTDVALFVRGKRMNKVRLLLVRLMNPKGLSEEVREKLEAYLLDHTLGCESDETWQVIRSEYDRDAQCQNLFAEIGGIREDNFDLLLKDAGSDQPQLRAFLLRYGERFQQQKDVFAGFEL